MVPSTSNPCLPLPSEPSKPIDHLINSRHDPSFPTCRCQRVSYLNLLPFRPVVPSFPMEAPTLINGNSLPSLPHFLQGSKLFPFCQILPPATVFLPHTHTSHIQQTNHVQTTPNYETYFPIQTYSQTIKSQPPPIRSSHVIYPTIAPLVVAFAQTWAPRIPPVLCQI
ncbi:hypothetical protein BDP55DRAFT_21555 [Colletotrichum godetiae]|uniref:Uncharacterized protein n=1 Tax=Colletotrichum godetiae TaxID=1209918 RepID=A0AAJ0F5H1_9PEZI|nr:uncharacterized protein BDP55DRAFT_21555 [Colletotrichum godetiae]KAK1701448.1 hypothetical protein BDP55DRAFT_21555 [Colletotrichum godetiae]